MLKVDREWEKKWFPTPDRITKGDLPGHEFHGNQWVAGVGMLDTSSTTMRPNEAMPAKVRGVQDRGTEMSTEAVQQRLAHYVGQSIIGGTMEDDKHWFDDAHATIGQLADQYNMDPTTLAAMIASTSPLTSWDDNVPKALLARQDVGHVSRHRHPHAGVGDTEPRHDQILPGESNRSVPG